MPRRNKRWQPPHPAETQKPVIEPGIDLTPMSQRKQRQLADDVGLPHCAIEDCVREPHPRYPLCVWHMLEVAEFVQSIDHNPVTIQVAASRAEAERCKADTRFAKQLALVESRGDLPGWIYYVLTDGKVKIGYSADITRRLRAYPPGSKILAVHPGTPDLEKLMHQRFGAYRVAGREWFRPDPEILDHCTQVVAEHGNPKRFAPKVRDPHDTNRVVAGKHWTGTKKTA